MVPGCHDSSFGPQALLRTPVALRTYADACSPEVLLVQPGRSPVGARIAAAKSRAFDRSRPAGVPGTVGEATVAAADHGGLPAAGVRANFAPTSRGLLARPAPNEARMVRLPAKM